MKYDEFCELPVGTRVKYNDGMVGTVGANGGRRFIDWQDRSRSTPFVDDHHWLSGITVVGDTTDEMIDGLRVSTDTLCYHLIPEVAMKRLCERISLGEQTKGKDAWNAMSDNQDVLKSPKALARRLGHLINHSYRLLGKLQNNEPWTEEDEKEASAVMWGGMFAICAIAAQRKQPSDL